MEYSKFIQETLYEPLPWEVLGIPEDSFGEAGVMSVCEEKQISASTDGRKNEILNAREKIASDEWRARARLLSPRPLSDIRDLLENVTAQPRYAGPGTWLRAIKGLHRQKESTVDFRADNPV